MFALFGVFILACGSTHVMEVWNLWHANYWEVELEDVVRQAIAELSLDVQQIEWRIEPLPEATCNTGLLKLVFTNLLSNAAKFSRMRQPPVIEIGTRAAEGVASFFVRDNGVRFDPQNADKLFGVFQRLHRQDEFEGTGIGLATVQRIVHRHGGEVWVESELGRGTTFFFTMEKRPQAAEQKIPAEVKFGNI